MDTHNIQKWLKYVTVTPSLNLASDSMQIAVKQCMWAGGGNFKQFLWRN
jgi:hypothetical protein